MSEQVTAVSDCGPCQWVHKMKGGEPLSVAVCMLCGSINWALLKEDFEKAAREYARTVMEKAYGRHDYPDGSRTICATGLYNIKQIYNLFAMPPGQNACEPFPGLVGDGPIRVVAADEELARVDGQIVIRKRNLK